MAASPPSAPGRIFISYRREETAFPAGWLYDRLAERFTDGQVFKDVDSIELGDDFVEVISTAVGSCDVLLALIGHQWLTITDEDGQRRLDDPNDFVRVEIEAALARNVRVIPILVEGARMPRAAELPPSLARLVRRQALELHPSRFDFDTGRLLRALERTLAEVRTAQQDAVVAESPAKAAPDPGTTEVQQAPEQQQQATPTAGISSTAATSAATRPPAGQAKPPDPSTTEIQQAPEQQKPPARTPIPSIPPAPATRAATRSPADQRKPVGTQYRRLSTRARVLAGAGIGIVLILVVVTIVANSRTTTGANSQTTTGSVIFQDNFSSQANGWEDAGSEQAGGHFNNDAYRIYATSGDPDGVRGSRPKNAGIVYPTAPDKLSIQVDAQRISGGQDTWYGITCRADATNGKPVYAFVIGDGHVEIGKDEASRYTVLKGLQASSVDADVSNQLQADCIGGESSVQLRLHVNGEMVVEFTDRVNPLPIGTVGLFASTDTDMAVEAQFDNFAVSQV